MCGRYNIASDITNSEMREIIADIEEEYKNKGQTETLAKMINAEIARTDTAPVLIMEGGAIRAVLMTFGIPLPRGGVEPNARRETIFLKPTWRKLILTNRGVVPCTSYFEWRHVGNKATEKNEITHGDGSLIYMPCIYGHYKDIAGNDYMAFAIVTAPANETISELHDRMPVILKTPQDRAAWMRDLDAARDIMMRIDDEKYVLTPKEKKQEETQQINMFHDLL